MAGSMTTSGTEELSRQLSTLGSKAGHIAARGLYEGAGVVADAYKAAVSQIQTAPRRHREGDNRLPTPEEKAALMGATGIAKFRGSGGEIDTIVGEPEGYGMVKGRRKALKLLARSINSGTNFMSRQPVFRKASSQSRGKAQQAMEAEVDRLINEIMNS
jgi:hypothetical protein